MPLRCGPILTNFTFTTTSEIRALQRISIVANHDPVVVAGLSRRLERQSTEL